MEGPTTFAGSSLDLLENIDPPYPRREHVHAQRSLPPTPGVVEVCDEGTRLPADVSDQIFSSFVRNNSPTI